MIANFQNASGLQALTRNCEAVVHGLKARRVYEVCILPVPWPRIIHFDRSFFAARINHPASHNGPHPTGPQPRGQLACSFSQAMLSATHLHIFHRARTNTIESSTSANHSACCSASTSYRFCYARKNDNDDPARSECRVCFEVASVSQH